VPAIGVRAGSRGIQASRPIVEREVFVFVLKLLLVPAFLVIVTLAGRRWGPGIAGGLAGLPVVTGPILFVLALEQGQQFAAVAAIASLLAVFSSVTFCVTYSHACTRSGWKLSILIALGVWFLVASLLAWLPSSIAISVVVAAIALVLAPRLFPRSSFGSDSATGPGPELALRASAGALLTVLVTFSAAHIGSAWSGLLTAFPVLGTVLAVFSHRCHGPGFVIVLLRAMAGGLYSSATFSLVLAMLLTHAGIPAAFVTAALASVLAQLAAMKFQSITPVK